MITMHGCFGRRFYDVLPLDKIHILFHSKPSDLTCNCPFVRDLFQPILCWLALKETETRPHKRSQLDMKLIFFKLELEFVYYFRVWSVGNIGPFHSEHKPHCIQTCVELGVQLMRCMGWGVVSSVHGFSWEQFQQTIVHVLRQVISMYRSIYCIYIYTLPETNTFAPETGWWKMNFLLRWPIFRGIS